MLLKPAIIRKSVVLPQPDGPSNVNNSPLRTLIERSGITTLPSSNFFSACCTVIATLITDLRRILFIFETYHSINARNGWKKSSTV